MSLPGELLCSCTRVRFPGLRVAFQPALEHASPCRHLPLTRLFFFILPSVPSSVLLPPSIPPSLLDVPGHSGGDSYFGSSYHDNFMSRSDSYDDTNDDDNFAAGR